MSTFEKSDFFNQHSRNTSDTSKAPSRTVSTKSPQTFQNSTPPEPKTIKKSTLLIITFFLGGIGGHKFYLGKYAQGILYLLFFWTSIPGIIAFVEFIRYAVTDEANLNKIFPAVKTNMTAFVLAVGIGCILVFGSLAAIAIPKFTEATAKAKLSEIPLVLATYENAQLARISETGTIGSLQDIAFGIPDSKWFSYTENKPGTLTAEVNEHIGKIPQGATFSTAVDQQGTVSHFFSGTNNQAVKMYMPGFLE